MSQHTPGPWRIGDAGHTVFGPKTDAPAPTMVAQRLTRANARLIAAAPDLLAALEDLLDLGRAGFIRGEDIAVTRAVDAARAAIAKAKGE